MCPFLVSTLANLKPMEGSEALRFTVWRTCFVLLCCKEGTVLLKELGWYSTTALSAGRWYNTTVLTAGSWYNTTVLTAGSWYSTTVLTAAC